MAGSDHSTATDDVRCGACGSSAAFEHRLELVRCDLCRHGKFDLTAMANLK
jgi:hypothetical protein